MPKKEKRARPKQKPAEEVDEPLIIDELPTEAPEQIPDDTDMHRRHEEHRRARTERFTSHDR